MCLLWDRFTKLEQHRRHGKSRIPGSQAPDLQTQSLEAPKELILPSTTSRKCVLDSLNHREPDRVPVDLSGYRSSGISAVTYPKLRAVLGLEPRPVDVYDPVQQLAICHDDVLDRLGVDTVELGRAFCH